MVDVGFSQNSEKGTATLFSSDVNGATGVCPRCDNESFCKPREFSAKAWQALLVWHEVEASLKNQALCNDCYLELREILIDRADEVEFAATQEPQPLSIVKIAKKRLETRKVAPVVGVQKPSFPPAKPLSSTAELAATSKQDGKESPDVRTMETAASLKAKDAASAKGAMAKGQTAGTESSSVPPKKKESILQKVANTVRQAVTGAKRPLANELPAKGLTKAEAARPMPKKAESRPVEKKPAAASKVEMKKSTPKSAVIDKAASKGAKKPTSKAEPMKAAAAARKSESSKASAKKPAVTAKVGAKATAAKPKPLAAKKAVAKKPIKAKAAAKKKPLPAKVAKKAPAKAKATAAKGKTSKR